VAIFAGAVPINALKKPFTAQQTYKNREVYNE
jgi:hypothetical protein